MRGWAGGRIGEAVAGYGVVHVRLVVWGVEVFAIPASIFISPSSSQYSMQYLCASVEWICYSRWEMVNGKDASLARLGREIRHLGTTIKQRIEAIVPQSNMPLCLLERIRRRITNRHTETLSHHQFQNPPPSLR